MLRIQGIPTRDINGLPYSVHQVGDDAWQVVIQNCPRHPAGYTFTPVYGSYHEALEALGNWPDGDIASTYAAGDDTGAAELAYYEDEWSS